MKSHQKNYYMNHQANWFKPEIRNAFFLLVISLSGLLTGFCRSALANPSPTQLFIEVRQAQITIKPQTKEVSFALQTSTKTKIGTSMNDLFETKFVSPGIYHFRNKNWKEAFWKVDIVKNLVYRVSEGTFGVQGGKEVHLKDVFVAVSYLQIDLRISRSILMYTASTNSLTLTLEGDEIVGPAEWEVQQARPGIFHIRPKRLASFFWKIDATELKVSCETYTDESGITVSHLLWEVRTSKFEPIKNENRITEDLDMKTAPGKKPKSEWYESEKAVYRNFLQRGTYDVLVVPFQVQNHATDRIDRLLMTRYLVRQIESSTKYKVPNPTLVAKALGEVQRRFDEKEVVELARSLKVKTLVRGYVGHDLNKQAKISIVVQTVDRSGQAALSPEMIFNFDNIAFSEERLPSDAFIGMLDVVMAKMPFKCGKPSPAKLYDRVKRLPVPDSLAALTGKPDSPVISAYYLQWLGTLYPEPSVAREYLFERSLAALLDVDPKSPDYPLLKARAYFYLHRRPAAVAVLRAPKTLKEKAFRAILDGNLPQARKYTAKIKAPLNKLTSQIELIDLRWQYDDKPTKKEISDIVDGYPQWQDLVLRRIAGNDIWQVQSNIVVKSLLDELLPVPNFSLKDILKKKAVLGEFDDDDREVDLSVYRHRIKLMEIRPDLFIDNGSRQPTKRDIVDLLYAISESNILNKVRLPVLVQILEERALTLIEQYESVYRGHADVTFLKARALWMASYSKRGKEKTDLTRRALDAQNDASYWLQGQWSNPRGRQTRPKCLQYDNDIPRRWFWDSLRINRDAEMNKYIPADAIRDTGKKYPLSLPWELNDLDLALQYANAEFSILETYSDKLLKYGWIEGADKLLQDHAGRFIGNPSKQIYLAKIREGRRDYDGAEKLYRKTIATTPNVWIPYERLGRLLIRKGMLREASELYSEYPPFIESRKAESDENLNTVSLSNHAYQAANALFWVGSAEYAIPLYQLSAGYQTGSGAGMLSQIVLDQVNGNFAKAAQGFLELAKRYNQTQHYAAYAAMLHLLGYHEEAWTVFENFSMIDQLSNHVRPVLVGFHMEGKSPTEQTQWLLQHKLKKISISDAQNFILDAHLVDRAPDRKVLDDLAEVDQKISLAQKGNGSSVAYFGGPIKKDRRWALWFADGYNNVRTRRYKEAYAIFSGTDEARQTSSFRSFSYALSYSAWSAMKSGHASEIEYYIKKYKMEKGETFDFHLARAFVEGGKKDHKAALANLKTAQFKLPYSSDRPFLSWYQLIEACELLFEETAHPGYRDLALKFAKKCQILRPGYAWTYAVEARYTSSKQDRMRALAIALYLDRRSERISKFSQAEKDRALVWLKDNNPFLKAKQTASKSEI